VQRRNLIYPATHWQYELGVVAGESSADIADPRVSSNCMPATGTITPAATLFSFVS
jgi:hypothetical protein